jgi:N-acyl-D-aspartate/D-glutamate deacylase
MRFDVVIRRGLVADGTGAGPLQLDVGVTRDRITALGDLSEAHAVVEVDASGKIVAPGFIDTHAHSDMAWSLPLDQSHVAGASIRQGVTTEVAGNCGFSPFPLVDEHRRDGERQLATLFGPTPLGWNDLSGYSDAASRSGLLANLAPLLGHGSLRVAVMGFDERAPTAEELAALSRLAEIALEQGAFGISSGLIYAPGMYAATEELVALASVAGRYGRVYTSHIRGETDMVADSVREAIRIGTEAGVPAHISHHKTAGKRNWGRTEETLAIIRAARAAGADITVDVYPYTAGSTLLQALLPAWAQEGGIERMLERLRDGGARDRIAWDFEHWPQGKEDLRRAAGWEGIVIATCPDPAAEGRSIAELADAGGVTPADEMFDLLVAHQARITVILDVMQPADVERVVSFEAATIGSDGLPIPGKPHPRLAGTFARILGSYVREKRQLDLVGAIRKMTSMPAERFGITDRGTIAKGRIADLVVFDADSVTDRATFAEPFLTPVGVSDVFVSGTAVVRNEQLTGARPGKVLAAR